MLKNTVTTFVLSKNGNKLSSRRVLYHLPNRLVGYDLQSQEIIQTELSPVSVALCPTPTCVRNCTFCSNRQRNRVNCQKGVNLKPRKFIQLVDDLVDLNVQGVSVAGGGEPLSYEGPIIEELFLRRDLPFRIGVHTNGVLLEKMLTRPVFSSGNVAYVNVSVLAHSAGLYQKVCGAPREQFSRVERNILEMLRLRDATGSELMPGVKILLCRENFMFATEMFNYFKALGVDNILIRCVGNFEPDQDVELDGDQLVLLRQIFQDGLGMTNNQIQAVTGSVNGEVLPIPSRCWICALQYTAGVDPDGETYLCSPWSQKEYSIGNVNLSNLGGIWGSKRHREIAEQLNRRLKSGQCDPLLCRHYYSNLAIDALIAGLIEPLPKEDAEKGYGRFI